MKSNGARAPEPGASGEPGTQGAKSTPLVWASCPGTPDGGCCLSCRALASPPHHIQVQGKKWEMLSWAWRSFRVGCPFGS